MAAQWKVALPWSRPASAATLSRPHPAALLFGLLLLEVSAAALDLLGGLAASDGRNFAPSAPTSLLMASSSPRPWPKV
jgi:hypothetical protein